MSKLGTAEINGKPVSFFEPPHKDGPYFPWIDVHELAAAFLPPNAAARMVQHAQQFGGSGPRVVTTAQNGDRIATIIPHVIGQGLCGAIDQWNGFKPAEEDESGPVYWAYCIAAGRFAAEHWPMSLKDMLHAFNNPGGHYMKGLADE